MPAAAISSSAWIVLTPKWVWRESSWSSSDAGVIGYDASTSGSRLRTLAAISPSDSAVVPLTLRYVPGATSRAGGTRYWTSSSSVVSPNDQPALNAARFACMTAGRFANFCSIQRCVVSASRPYSHDRTPSANRFLARPASRVDAPSTASTAPTVIDVIGSRWTRYSLSEPSSSGLAS